MPRNLRLLDLFCGAGMASDGYAATAYSCRTCGYRAQDATTPPRAAPGACIT